MKQTILHPRPAPLVEICAGKLLFVWALYGYAVSLLWKLAGGDSWAHAAIWGLAAVAGLIFAWRMWEV
jgi:hypothetical protein